MLKEGISDHSHERVSVKAVPGSALEVVEPESFLHLLVGLVTNPSRLDDGSQGAHVRLGGQVGEIVFLLSCRAVFANEPGLVPRQMLLTLIPDPLRRSVG